MTTKYRIIVGFTVVLLLLGAMAFFGFSSLQTASTNFIDYRRLANVNVASSDLESSVNESLASVERFLGNRKPEYLEQAKTRLDRAYDAIKRAREISNLEATLTTLDSAEKLLNVMRSDFDNIQTNMETVQAIFQKDCLPNMLKTEEILQSISNVARTTLNVEALYYQTHIWNSIASVREYMTRFLVTLDMKAGADMMKALDAYAKSLAEAGSAMTSPQGRRDFAVVQTAFQNVMKGFASMEEAGKAVKKSVDEAHATADQVLALVHELSKAANARMLATGTATLDSNSTSQTQLLILSLVGLLLGAGFAAYTLVALVRTLSKMSQFASDIAAGNFASNIRIAEKGEIGAMFQALRRIPEIFAGVIGRCNTIANDISSGLFRDRLELKEFEGGFKELAQGINSIADAYTHSIDNLPVGIATLDRQLKTRFTNSMGAKMMGDDAARAFGGNMPLLESSIRDNKHRSGETRVTTPENVVLEVAATALPLKNREGEIVAGLEVLTDITEIKEKQKIMLQVANEASSISDRVAAASEQLAAQVEEVSRGAEVQRSRVESTASAMSQMNATVMEVARSAGEASEQSEQTRNDAQSGAQLVSKVVGAINEVNTIATRLQGNMQTLGDQANSIGSVMNVISDIADQTNLLALNAAIEAARAGEAGRGFAVVADEVRKLAESTMNATKEVGASITAIQTSAQTNIQEVGVAAKNVGEATELANASGEALEGIVSLASNTSSVVSAIATAAEQQSAASEEISQAVDEINRLVTETTDGMIQSSSAVQDLSRTAQELRRVMEGLR